MLSDSGIPADSNWLEFSKTIKAMKEMENMNTNILNLNLRKYIKNIEVLSSKHQGTAIYIDGSKYIGEWKDHLYEGKGILTTPKGFKYVGY